MSTFANSEDRDKMLQNVNKLPYFCFQRKERAEQIAYKLEQDLALCKYMQQR